MKILNLGILFALLVSCAPRAIPVVVTKTPSSLPLISKIDDGINTTINNNNKFGEKLKDQSNKISEQKQLIADAIIQTELLKKKIETNKAISKEELNKLVDNFRKVEDRNRFIEVVNSELSTDKNNQAIVLVALQKDLSTTKQQVSDKEHEADNLRNATEIMTKDNASLKKKLDAATIKAASASVYKNWILGIVGAFILYVIIKNILMVYFPLIKFRI